MGSDFLQVGAEGRRWSLSSLGSRQVRTTEASVLLHKALTSYLCHQIVSVWGRLLCLIHHLRSGKTEIIFKEMKMRWQQKCWRSHITYVSLMKEWHGPFPLGLLWRLLPAPLPYHGSFFPSLFCLYWKKPHLTGHLLYCWLFSVHCLFPWLEWKFMGAGS